MAFEKKNSELTGPKCLPGIRPRWRTSVRGRGPKNRIKFTKEQMGLRKKRRVQVLGPLRKSSMGESSDPSAACRKLQGDHARLNPVTDKVTSGSKAELGGKTV